MKKENEIEVKEKRTVVFVEDKNVVIKGEVKSFKKGSKHELEKDIADKLISNKVAEQYKEPKVVNKDDDKSR